MSRSMICFEAKSRSCCERRRVAAPAAGGASDHGHSTQSGECHARESGIQTWQHALGRWIPAYAGMTQR